MKQNLNHLFQTTMHLQQCNVIILLSLLFRTHTTNALTTTPYKMLDYDTIYDTLYALQEQYPNLIDVYTAQEAPFELPSPGSCGSSGPCRQVYARITDETTLPDKDRPEVFLSGALHGNERVGPTTTLEFVRMLLKHYTASTTSTASTSTRSQDWLTRLVSRRALWVMPSANAYGYYHN